MKIKEGVEKVFSTDPLYDIFYGISIEKYLDDDTDVELVLAALDVIEETIETIMEVEE